MICRVLAVTAFVLLTALSAFVRIPLPFTPVPFTLQTFFVLLSGSLLGRKLGFFTQSLYMLLGLAGFQVFAGTGVGRLYLFGPTGGYIAGFVLASFLAGGLFAREKQGWPVILLTLLFADLALLSCGMLWLKVSLSWPLSRAFLLGFLPFIPGDILKVIFAAAIHRGLRSRIKAAIY
ncbi:biotin transporter BioY [bacterium]|nr:MAG: biotin transporter BioY [bacterium]